MEELLNKLIEKGWTKKPHHLQGLPKIPFVRRVKDSINGVEFYYYEWWDNEAKLVKIYSLRDIVSIDLGLWQFVCENGMVKDVSPQILMWQRVADKELSKFIGYNYYEYRLIESELYDEDKLEEFLLSNIKIEGKND